MQAHQVALDYPSLYSGFGLQQEYLPTPSYYFQTYKPVSHSRRYQSAFHSPMEPYNNNTMATKPTTDDMEEFQKLSNRYEPDLQGPLVGPKQSSSMISSEYANADPVFVNKTNALTQSHSHYRIMKGDGNCGWRAVAFGYFENLFNLRDTTKVAEESARIKSFNKLFDSTGLQEHLYEIFVDATEELLAEISNAIQKGDYDDSFLVDAFNSDYASNAIITHFRLMTSAWMKLNPARYEAFLSIPLEQYCSRTIETVKTEIDEYGLQGLVDGVIEGSGLAVEILYLDRSEGNAVTPHLLSPDRLSLATIRLLYRPGHYDLLYQTDHIPTTTSTVTPVNFQYAMSSDYIPWCSNALPFELNPVLMSIPSLPLDTTTFSPPLQQTPQYVFSMPENPDPNPPSVPQTPVSPTPQFPPSMPLSPVSVPDRSELQVRLNPLVREPMNTLPLSTVPFKNSHYNQAHFQNPDFQPSQWDPLQEYK